MKKFVLALAMTALLLSLMGIIAFSVVHPDSYHPVDHRDTQLLGKVAITLLIPEIQEAVSEFYAPYLNVAPAAVAYLGDAGITELRESESRSRYLLTLEIEPFVGPHIPVGRDRLRFEIDAGGAAQCVDFTHLKSLPLPEHYNIIVIEPLP